MTSASAAERVRQQALGRLQILDTPPEPDFDALARLAAHVCGAPIALLALLDGDRQWFKAHVGIETTETPRDQAFCDHAVLDAGALLVVPDAQADRHAREDEYSFVLEGRMGAQLGDDVVFAEAGDFVFKPRDQWHTFWNAGDTPCRVLEIISPGGFEHFFDEVAAQMRATASGNPAATATGESSLDARYAIEFDPESVPRLCQAHGLVFPA